MTFVHYNPNTGDLISNEAYFFTDGHASLTLSTPSWSGDAFYRGPYTYRKTGVNSCSITLDTEREGYNTKIKHTYILDFSSPTEARGSCREVYTEAKRPQMNYDRTFEVAVFIR